MGFSIEACIETGEFLITGVSVVRSIKPVLVWPLKILTNVNSVGLDQPAMLLVVQPIAVEV